MRVTIESTDKLVRLNGAPARIWEGKSEGGVPVICFVTRVAVQEGMDPACYERFEQELLETRPASPEARSFDPRLIL